MDWFSSIRSITPVMSRMAFVASPVKVWMARILAVMSSVAPAGLLARALSYLMLR